MRNFVNRPELKKYLRKYTTGDILFTEGDTSKDLYLLANGKIDLFKGDKKIAEISEPGSLFGEMSFLLHSKRSATAKANGDVEAAVIPTDEVASFLEEFPAIAPEITRLLAQRLLETTRVVHCYKEFCDQLPDAVVMTDKNLKILAWNIAAEKLYGRSWNQMQDKLIQEIYEDQANFQRFIDELLTQRTVREKPLKVTHPLESWLFVSTSTTVLYDVQQNIDGYIFIGRDVTHAHSLQQNNQLIKTLLMPAAMAIILLLGILLWNYPQYREGKTLIAHRKEVFAERIVQDYPYLTTTLAKVIGDGDLAATTHIMEDYCNRKEASLSGIKGLVLLDTDKNVMNAYSSQVDAGNANMFGSSYGESVFNGNKDSVARAITVLGRSNNTGKNREEVELAFKISGKDDFLGWLLFQFDPDVLRQEFGVTTDDLKSFRLPVP